MNVGPRPILQRTHTTTARRSCIRRPASRHFSSSSAQAFPLMARPFPPRVLLYRILCRRIYVHVNPQLSLPLPLLHHAFPFLVPRDTRTTRPTELATPCLARPAGGQKRGSPRCVATSSVFVLRLPSAPRTNPTSRASRTRRLPVCRYLDAFPRRPILFSIELSTLPR